MDTTVTCVCGARFGILDRNHTRTHSHLLINIDILRLPQYRNLLYYIKALRLVYFSMPEAMLREYNTLLRSISIPPEWQEIYDREARRLEAIELDARQLDAARGYLECRAGNRNLGAQNVHDSVVVRGVDHSIAALIKLYPDPLPLSSITVPPEQSSIIYEILGRGESWQKWSEEYILRLVWTHIKHFNTREIYDMFNLQLSDMVMGSGGLVCLNGRVSRMIDTFTTFDDTIRVVTPNDIHEEMMTRAAKLRDTYKEGSIVTLAEYIRNGLVEDYVTSGRLHQHMFDSMVNAWINDI